MIQLCYPTIKDKLYNSGDHQWRRVICSCTLVVAVDNSHWRLTDQHTETIIQYHVAANLRLLCCLLAAFVITLSPVHASAVNL